MKDFWSVITALYWVACIGHIVWFFGILKKNDLMEKIKKWIYWGILFVVGPLLFAILNCYVYIGEEGNSFLSSVVWAYMPFLVWGTIILVIVGFALLIIRLSACGIKDFFENFIRDMEDKFERLMEKSV